MSRFASHKYNQNSCFCASRKIISEFRNKQISRLQNPFHAHVCCLLIAGSLFMNLNRLALLFCCFEQRVRRKRALVANRFRGALCSTQHPNNSTPSANRPKNTSHLWISGRTFYTSVRPSRNKQRSYVCLTFGLPSHAERRPESDGILWI